MSVPHLESMAAAEPAYRVDGQLVGPAEFYAVACDPARHVVVEACAGAGKTWMLVSRIVRALLEGTEPQEILAITFTRKAAGEMRVRLQEWLAQWASGAVSEVSRVQALQERGLDLDTAKTLAPALAGLQQRLQRSGRSVEIRTFHGWFSQLLKAAPIDLLIDLGLQRDAQIIEDRTDHEADVYRRFHAAVLAGATLRDDFQTLVQRHGRSQLRKWLDTAWDKRVEIELADAAGTLLDSVKTARSPWPVASGWTHPAQWLRCDPIRETLIDCAKELGSGAGKKRGAAAEQMVVALGMPDDEACFSALWAALFTNDDEPRKGLGDGPHQRAAMDVLESVHAAIEQHLAHDEHQRMVRLSRALFAEVAAYKTASGLIEMADLERCAVALLSDSELTGWIQERLDARVRQVLIDEFQDTSPLQWHALSSWLSGYAGAGGGASGQRPPSVFIVGDPKQSIYRFRRAEPRVFEAARDFVSQQLEGQVLSCDHTRRNAPQVLAALNPVFCEAEGEGLFHGFRPHSTALGAVAGAGVWTLPLVEREPTARGGQGDDATWRDSLVVPRSEPETRRRQQEADQVAEAIRDAIAAGTPPHEIHVLCRKRESLRLVAMALASLGVGCASVDETPLAECPEVRDLVAVLDVLASPGHALSLAQALKSPVFGCSDADLVQIATAVASGRADAAQTPRRADPLAWWNALHSLPDASPELARAQELLARWHALAQSLPPHDLLDLIVHQGSIIERTVAAVPPTRRAWALSAISALLAQSLMLDGARAATPYNFVRALRRRSLKIAVPVQTDVVQLLTIHGAKGLEAEVVFVMDNWPERATTATATLLVQWPVGSPAPQSCAFVYSESRCPQSLDPLMRQELAARQREELNALYVAMTRARHRLVFSATQPHSSSGRAWWDRIAHHATDWTALSAAPADPPLQPPPCRLLELPQHSPSRQDEAVAVNGGDSDSIGSQSDSVERRLGLAVHRALEWSVRGELPTPDRLAGLCEAAAAEFDADAAAVGRVASAILKSAACQRFFDPAQLLWAGNEVSVADDGEPLRIDRLVCTANDRTWWVLDYKLSQSTPALETYRPQMQRYRRAVSRLQPGEPVRCAFITSAGQLVEIDA